MTDKKIMFIGMGGLGALVLDIFTRYPHRHHCIVAGRNLENVRVRANLSTLVARQLGFNPSVDCAYVDVHDIERTADTIAQLKPDIIFSSLSLQSWNGITATLPKPVVERAGKARNGSWLPVQLTLVLKLMQAIKQSGLDPTVISASYPDVLHPMLSKANLAPQIGIGNVANCVPALRSALAFVLKQPLEKIDVRLIAAHAWSSRADNSGDTKGAPYHLTVLVNGEDKTAEVNVNSALELLTTKFKRPGGMDRTLMTAASSITVLDAVANQRDVVVHAPGPNGLPGGYPVRIKDGKSFSIELPKGLSLADAIRINEECLRFDGIEAIDDGGAVHFTDSEVAIMKETFGYDKKKMALLESEDCSNELIRCWNRFVEKSTQVAV